MAYVLGFWFADGSIENAPKMRGKYIRVTNTDRHIISEIKKALDSDHTIVVDERIGVKTRYLLRIGNKTLFKKIKALGVKERKSLTMEFPKVPKKYFSSFIRGYFDGDGCVHLERDGEGKIKRLTVIFTSGSVGFLKRIQSNFHKRVGTSNTNKIRLTKGKGSAYQIRYSTHDSLKVFKLMYLSEENKSLYLRRKYDIFTQYLKEKDLQMENLNL